MSSSTSGAPHIKREEEEDVNLSSIKALPSPSPSTTSSDPQIKEEDEDVNLATIPRHFEPEEEPSDLREDGISWHTVETDGETRSFSWEGYLVVWDNKGTYTKRGFASRDVRGKLPAASHGDDLRHMWKHGQIRVRSTKPITASQADKLAEIMGTLKRTLNVPR